MENRLACEKPAQRLNPTRQKFPKGCLSIFQRGQRIDRRVQWNRKPAGPAKHPNRSPSSTNAPAGKMAYNTGARTVIEKAEPGTEKPFPQIRERTSISGMRSASPSRITTLCWPNRVGPVLFATPPNRDVAVNTSRSITITNPTRFVVFYVPAATRGWGSSWTSPNYSGLLSTTLKPIEPKPLLGRT